MEGYVLGVNSGTEFTVHFNFTNFERLHGHRLSGQNVADLGGADTKGDGTEGPVGCGVRVATCDG